MGKYIILPLFCLFFVFSCKSNNVSEEVDTNVIQVDLIKDSPLFFSDLFDEVEYLALETKDSFLIGEVGRIKIKGNRLYILQGNSILCFDTESGEGLLNLNKTGSAPGEYLTVTDLFLTEKGGIEILDRRSRKIIAYDQSGDFTGEFEIPLDAFSFYKSGEYEYWFYTNNMISEVSNHQLVLYNIRDKEVKAQFLPINEKLAEYYYVIERNNFNRFTDLSFFSNTVCSIYKFNGSEEIAPSYTIDFLRNQMPDSFMDETFRDIMDFAERANQKEYVYFIKNLVEDENSVIFSYRLQNTEYLTFYQKSQNRTFTGSQLADDFNFDNMAIPIEYYNSSFTLENGNFYLFIYPIQLIEVAEKYNQRNIPLPSVLSGLYSDPDFTEESNPVLLIAGMK